MLSEHSSIDELFRKKEEDFLPAGNREEAHWLQMKTMLASPGITPPRKRRRIINRRIFMYTSGIVIITFIVTTLLLHTVRNTRAKYVATAKAVPHKNISKRPASKAGTGTAISKVVPANHPPQKNKSYSIVTVTTRYIAATTGRKPVKRNAYTGYTRGTAKTPYPAPADTTTTIPVKEAPAAAALLNRFYSQLQQEPQEFLINTFRDTLLVAKQGTRLFIPSRAFVSRTGKSITGTVKIVLEEFYSYDKMLAAGLGTTSNGEQLVSGGMLHIVALSDGHELLLQPSMNITVKMQTNNYDGRMQLFTGNTPPVNTPAATHPFIDAAQVSFHTEGDTSAWSPTGATGNKEIDWMAAGQWQERYMRESIRVMNMLNKPASVSYGKNATIAVFHIHRHKHINKKEVKAELEKRYGYYYDKITVKYKGHAGQGDYWDQSAIDVSLTGDSIIMSLNEALKYGLVSTADSLKYTQNYIADSIRYFTGVSKVKKEYTFNVETLGWINCDRFERDPRPKVAFTLNLGEGAEARNFHAQLIFTRYQSVMTGYYGSNKFLFSKIPDQEPVQLICVGVKNGRVVTCVQPLTVSAREVSNLVFEETTPEQFKQKLKALNLQ